MSEKLRKELKIKEELKLICVDDTVLNNSKPAKIEDIKLPEIQCMEAAKSQDDLVKKLSKYLSESEEFLQKNEISHNKTDLEELKNTKRDDKSIVGFNKIKFDKINDQIQALKPNDTLEVLKDTFHEHIDVKMSIHIIANPTVTIKFDAPNDVLTCSGCDVVFENISFDYQGSGGFSAARITSGTATFINCKFSSSDSFGVVVQNSSRATFIDCVFTNSKQSNILVEGNALITLTNCKIYGAEKFGIELTGKSAASVSQCEINRSGSGVSIMNHASALFSQCKITTNRSNGFQIKSKSTNIILKSNEISNHQNDCGILIDNSNVKLFSNKIAENQSAIQALNCSTVTTRQNNITTQDSSYDYGFVVINKSTKFVSTDDVYEGNVKYAINIGGSDSEFVGENITFKNILIGSGFYINPQGKIKINNCRFIDIGSYCVYTHASNDAKKSSKITIQNCSFVKTNDAQFDSQQKLIGICINDKVKATINNCTITNLQKAIALRNSQDDVSVKNCNFENLKVTSIESTNSCGAVFENCHIKNTEVTPEKNASISGKGPSDDGSIKFVGCSFSKALINVVVHPKAYVEFNECLFEKSNEQSVHIAPGGSAYFNNCSFKQNRFPGLIVGNKEGAKNAKTDAESTKAIVENSTFDSNDGNGFICQGAGSFLSIKNSKIFDHIRRAGGGTFKNFAKGVIENCEIYNNLKNNVEVSSQAEVEIINSNIHSSKSNTGICVLDGGILKMTSTVVHDENSTGLYISPKSSAILNKCSFYNCSLGGITFIRKDDLANPSANASSLELKECHLHNCNPFGVIYFSGNLKVEKCKFEQNSSGDIGKYAGATNFTIDPSQQIKVIDIPKEAAPQNR